MSNIKIARRCQHCGAYLQSNDPKAKGYIDKNVVKNNSPYALLYCSECYEMMVTLNSRSLDLTIDDDVLSILDDAVATDAIIVWVVDLFSFNGTLNPDIIKKIKGQKVIVVGTKRDLLPKSTKDEGIKSFLKERFNVYGVEPVGIMLYETTMKLDYDALIEKMNEIRAGHDVFMIGNSSSGKTNLINHFLKFYKNNSKREIKTIVYPNTELNVLEIPLSRSSFLYELPGISQTTSIVSKVEKELLKYIVPKKVTKVVNRTFIKGDCLLVGSLAFFEMLKGKPTPTNFFSSEMTESKKVQVKFFNREFANNMITKEIRPVSIGYKTFIDYDTYEVTLPNDGKRHDIAIEGFCWLSFKATGQVFRVGCPKGVSINEYVSKVR